MLVMLFSVYDNVTKKYGVPFAAENVGAARRQFEHLVLDQSTFFNSHPDDYSVFCVGVMNDQDGKIDTTDFPADMLFNPKDILKR